MNTKIINQFQLLLKQIQFQIDYSSLKEKNINVYRYNSIKKVIKILEKYDEPIKSTNQLQNINGIGENSLVRIDEILETGKLSELKLIQKIIKHSDVLEKLENVIGIGRKKAYELFTKYNVTSVNKLKKMHKNGTIKLSDNVVCGLKYFDNLDTNIPHKVLDEIKNFLIKCTSQIDTKLIGIVCGSYRRELPTSNDIDFIITHTDIQNKNYLTLFIKKLKDVKFITDSLTCDNVETKYMGFCKYKEYVMRIDIRYVPYDSYYTAILYFTGSKEFNKKMRKVAIKNGYMLNEYGLYDEKNNKQFKINSEKDVFDALNMHYLSPNDRNI